jgi:hypothetical protein
MYHPGMAGEIVKRYSRDGVTVIWKPAHTFRSDAAFATLSPDGQHIVYTVVPPKPPPRLWLYTLATQVARELPGTEQA